MRSFRRPILLLSSALLLPGCQTIYTQIGYCRSHGDWSRAQIAGGFMNYAGTRANARLWRTPNPFSIPTFDLPLCAVLDTLILPITVLQTNAIPAVYRERAKRERAASEARSDPEAIAERSSPSSPVSSDARPAIPAPIRSSKDGGSIESRG